MMRRPIFHPVFVLCTLALFIAGCQNQEASTDESEHGHGHTHAPVSGPKSFADAVAQLRGTSDQINTAMENGEPDSAHDPLHNVGNLLNKLPELATDTDLSESEWTEVKEETDRVFKAFGTVDAAFHKGGDKIAAYDSAKSAINEGISALESKVAASGSKLTSEHDDEEHDHHDEDHDH